MSFPLPKRLYQEVLNPSKPRFLHPFSGLIILGLDWTLFGGDVASLTLLTPVLMVAGFFLGGSLTCACQRVLARESWFRSFSKGFLAGVAVGLPLPVAGTFAGGIVLTISGLAALRQGTVRTAREIVRNELASELTIRPRASDSPEIPEEPEMVVQCARCGTQNDPHSLRCVSCGTPVRGVTLLDQVDHKSGRPVGSFIVVMICSVYLLNPLLGLDILPDNIPILGNLDDAGAMFLLMRAMAKLGWIDPSRWRR